MKVPTAVFVVAVLLVSCGADPTTEPTGRLDGQVLAGPTCPVERPGEVCEPAPVTGSVVFTEGDRVVVTIELDTTGSYTAELPTGPFFVTIDVGDTPFPRCEPVYILVVEGDNEPLDIMCDTGIR
ncbi:MAG: hypothetical protein OEO77_08845 [Acidimicrobiia bacterium]|nr:hypothetical protein [Acidimicrobiia bacterium]